MDRDTGEVHPAQVFVAILTCSQYTYVQATASQKREDLVRAITDFKSWMGQAIGHQACLMLRKARYFITTRFFEATKMAKLNGSWEKLLFQISKADLLILDDLGLHPMDSADRNLLMDLIEAHHGDASTIICSQIPINGWHQLIGEGTIADAILDRAINSSHRIELKGESQRKKHRLNQST